jgi:hypothetical protein
VNRIMEQSSKYVCWRSDQHHPYESAWSLMQKFCFWNAVRFKDIWPILAREPHQRVSQQRFLVADAASWFDRTKFLNYVPITADTLEEAFLERYIPKNEPCAVFILTSLHFVRYCPRCISEGYHSPIHDLLFVSHCPIHEEPLTDKCPICLNPIEKTLPRSNGDAAYSCKCGHPLWISGHSPRPSDEGIRRMRAAVAWIDRVQSKILRNLNAIGRFKHTVPERINSAPSITAYLVELDPSLSPPVPISGRNPGERRLSLIRSNIDAGIFPNSAEALVAVYKAIARKITGAVRTHLKRKNPKRSKCSYDGWIMAKSVFAVKALNAWRVFWEGLDPYRADSAMSRRTEVWQPSVIRQLRLIYSAASETDLSAWASWSDSHLLGAACWATFVECVCRARDADGAMTAGEISKEINGRLAPFCLAEEHGEISGSPALHLWLRCPDWGIDDLLIEEMGLPQHMSAEPPRRSSTSSYWAYRPRTG